MLTIVYIIGNVKILLISLSLLARKFVIFGSLYLDPCCRSRERAADTLEILRRILDPGLSPAPGIWMEQVSLALQGLKKIRNSVFTKFTQNLGNEKIVGLLKSANNEQFYHRHTNFTSLNSRNF